jgi:hypothetical protein
MVNLLSQMKTPDDNSDDWVIMMIQLQLQGSRLECHLMLSLMFNFCSCKSV